MVGSVGCPFSCEFCVDATTKYQTLDSELLRNDLRFLAKQKRPIKVLWHDPNFGVKFNQTVGTIESVSKPKTLTFGGEMNLSKLNEGKMERLRDCGFWGLAPGVESWSTYGKKTSKKKVTGLAKVHEVSEKLRTLAKYIPFIQVNMIFGLDDEEDHFELTAEFLKLTPQVYTNFQTLTVFGESAPHFQRYKEQGRLLESLPFFLMDGYSSTNVILDDPIQFYQKYSQLYEVARSWSLNAKRIWHSQSFSARLTYLLKRLAEDRNMVAYYQWFSERLKTPEFANFYLGTGRVPKVYLETWRKDLGSLGSGLDRLA
jgi:hypothetical protein